MMIQWSMLPFPRKCDLKTFKEEEILTRERSKLVLIQELEKRVS